MSVGVAVVLPPPWNCRGRRGGSATATPTRFPPRITQVYLGAWPCPPREAAFYRESIDASSPPPFGARRSCESLRPSAYFRRKAILDRTLAILLLLPGLPIIGMLVLLVRLTSRGPGIYHQVRLGQHGRRFQIYKIRTMRHDAEAASGPVWTTQARDPRVTRVGKVLRRLHLDELPQLINILKGEMSLVGPRPERPEFVHVLTEAIPGYGSRLDVPPGVTGLAQLNLPPDSDLTSVRRKLVLDREYMEQAGLSFDLRILASTFFRMLRVPEALAAVDARPPPDSDAFRDPGGNISQRRQRRGSCRSQSDEHLGGWMISAALRPPRGKA